MSALVTNTIQGLYVINSQELLLKKLEVFTDIFKAAMNGGAKIVQYRNKLHSNTVSYKQKILQVETLLTLCDEYRVPLIINDNVDLALRTNAGGVHLGKDDNKTGYARKYLGENKIIGLSCYNSLDNISTDQHASYFAFGTFFPSHTKPQAKKAEKSMLLKAKKLVKKPIVAIGGINHCNSRELIELGADSLAVIEAVFDDLQPSLVERKCTVFAKKF